MAESWHPICWTTCTLRLTQPDVVTIADAVVMEWAAALAAEVAAAKAKPKE
jgi:hypothetical protein